METLNVGVIGSGSRARSHLPVLLKLRERYNLIAVCDVDLANAKSAADETGARPYTDMEGMLGKEKLDVCLIAVQAEGHHVVAKALAERGIHMITETPLAITTICADQMIEAARADGVQLEVSENVPRWPHERLKQRVVADGLLGDIKEFYLSYTSGSYHGIAAIRSILRSEAVSTVGEFPTEDAIRERAEIKFANGVKGVYEFNRDKGNYWEIEGAKGALAGNQLRIFEGDRRFEIRNEEIEIGGKTVIAGAGVVTRPELAVRVDLGGFLPDSYDEVAIADAWISLHNAIVKGQVLTYGAENARKDIELLMAIRESESHGGSMTQLPLREITEHEMLIHKEFAKVYGSDPLELSVRQLKTKYVLPGHLRELMYHGRLPP